MIATQMEATFCRAYNVSKGRQLGLRITLADCAGEPFKLMKVILDGLAQNPDAAFWLTNLEHTPQIVRIFPLDFAYLDPDLNVLQGVELPPGVPLPKFHPEAASALILPLTYLASNGTSEGDQLLICPEHELEQRIAELGPAVSSKAPESERDVPSNSGLPHTFPEPSPSPAQVLDQLPFFAPSTTVPSQTAAVGTSFTLAIAGAWQVTTATTIAPTPASAIELDTELSPSPMEVADPKLSIEEVPELPGSLSLDSLESMDPEPPHRQQQPPAIDLTELAVLDRALAKSEPKPVPAASVPVLDEPQPILRATEALIARSKEAAEKTYVKVAVPTGTPAAKPKKKSEPSKGRKKDHLGNKVIRWLALDEPLPERRKIIRLLLQGLQAYEANGDHSMRYEVRDICPPGLYIRTDQPWKQGDLLSLVLVKEGATEKDHEHRVSIQARVVRRDQEGAAVAFVFPEGTEFQPWQRAKTKRSDETESDFILRELRLARALGFLRRLCPWSADEVNHALLDRFSNKRVAAAVEITLKAEDLLIRRGHVAQPFIASDLVIRILEGGSWIEEDWIRRMWAGLLVSSCSADGQDRSNLPFIDLLARLTPIHLRILSFICHRGVEALAAGESEASLDLYSTAEELMEAADSHSFPRIQQTIGQLSSVGLLAETARPSYVAMSDKSKTRTTPTSLGLKMYARCNGHRS